jgi:hypothetical protein
MDPTPFQSVEHPRFDELCSHVEDFEPLPTVVARPAEPGPADTDEDQTGPIDGLILAGLVSPY